jgi:hypothetical protein
MWFGLFGPHEMMFIFAVFLFHWLSPHC